MEFVGNPFINLSYYEFIEPKLVPSWEVVLKCVLVAVIIFLSIIGNILIIVIVFRNKQMHTATNYYIVNLAVADLMVTAFCTWVSLVDDLKDGWVLGAFLCKFNSFTQVMSLVASVLSLTLIAYDRFFGIVFAMRAHMSDKHARGSLIIIWLCAIGVGTPFLFYRDLFTRQWADNTEVWCQDDFPVSKETLENGTVRYSPSSRTIYYVFVSAILFFLPMVVMVIAYSFIVMKLWVSVIPGEIVDQRMEAQTRTKRKVIVMLVVIVVVFCACWLPYNIILLYTELRTDRDKLGSWFEELRFAALCMAYSNSAVNPLIYAGFNSNFKKGLLEIWKCLTCNKKHMYNSKSYGTYEMTTATNV